MRFTLRKTIEFTDEPKSHHVSDKPIMWALLDSVDIASQTRIIMDELAI